MPEQVAGRPRWQSTLALATLLFVVIFVITLAIGGVALITTVLLVIPVALVAVEFGARGGLIGAATAMLLFAAGDALSGYEESVRIDTAGAYLARGIAFLVIAAVLGTLAERLRRTAAEHDRFWRLTNEPMTVAGSDGYFRRLNPAWQEVLGWSEEELRSRRFAEFVHPDDRERTELETSRLLGEHRTTGFQNRFRCKDGSYRTLLWNARAVDPPDGEIYAAARDISDQVEIAEQLQEAKEVAERASLAKSEFLSRVSHELRTPLAAIIGFAQLVELDESEPQKLQNIGEIVRAGRHLSLLIDDLLDISQIEAGELTISLEPVQLDLALTEAVSLITPMAGKAEIQIRIRPGGDEATQVLADRRRVQQVLLNLLSNGIKYNRPGGSVEVSYEQRPDGRMLIAVADTGKGMDAEQIAKIFTPFERAGAEASGIEGAGLGLPLAQQLVGALGGTIQIDSTPDVGTTVSFDLARADAPG